MSLVTRVTKGALLSHEELDSNFSYLETLAAQAGTAAAGKVGVAEVDARISAIVGAAPAALDTLAEIATQLAADETAQAALTTSIAGKASLSDNNAFTGLQTFGKAVIQKAQALVSAAIDVSLGSLFSKTIAANTTFTVSNVPASGNVASFILDLINGGAFSITWWSGVKWAGGTAPTLTAAGRDVLGFYTYDGGTTWVGILLSKDVK